MNTAIRNISLASVAAVLAFSASLGNCAPRLHIQQQNGKVIMDWDGKGKLEWAPSPEGPWETVGNVQSPFAIEQNPSGAFFRIRQTDDEVHHDATWLLDLLPPVEDDPKSFDETLLRFISIRVCALEPDGSCTNVAVLTSADIRLQNNFYHVDWDAPVNLTGKDLKFHVSVAGLEAGVFDQPGFSRETLPIKFRIDDHPRIRARALHEQGFTASDVAAVLAAEFALDATETARILFWENYDATAVALALRDVFHMSAEATAGLLKAMGRNAAEVIAGLRGAYALTAQNTAQILQTLGYPCLEIAVALSESYQLTFAEVLPIMRAVGCAPADNCEYPPPPPGDNTRTVTANLLWFLPSALRPLPPIAGHLDNFDTSLLPFLVADVFEIDQNGNRTLIAQPSIKLYQNFYTFSWKPSQAQQGRNFQASYSVAGLDLGFTPIAADPGNLPFKFRMDNHPAVRARVLHHLQTSAAGIANALRDEFGLTADEVVRILYEEMFAPGDIGIALNTDPVQAAAAFRGAGLSATTALQMLEAGFGELNVTNNVATLRLAGFPISQVWRALEIVRGLTDKDIEGILIAGGFTEEEVMAELAPRLLAKYACLIDKSGPIVYLHPDEIYMPASVDWFLERASLVWSNAAGIDRRQVTAANLTQTTQEIEAGAGKTRFWMELPEAHRRGNFESAKAYVHAVRLKDMGMTDLQFWMFRAYNGPGTVRARAEIDPIGGVCSGDAVAGNMRPLGEHTGDWEAVYLRFDDATGQIVNAFTSQHGADPFAPTNRITFEGAHPVFYASLNGHANYIEIGDNDHIEKSFCERPFYVTISTVNRTGKGRQFPIHQKYDFVGLDRALLDAPWIVFPGKWSPGNPFNLTDDQKEDIVRAVAGNCINLVRGAIPVACAVVCAPLSILLVGYWPCFAACTAAGEIAIDPLLEDYAPAIVDKAFKDQSEGEPTTPGSKTSEWIYFRYPGERAFEIGIAELDPEAPLILQDTITVKVTVPNMLTEKAPEDNDCATDHPLDSSPFPANTVELVINGAILPILSVDNLPDRKIYSFQWNTTTFADGTYTLRPRAFATNGFAYQNPFGTEVIVANNSVVLRLRSAQPAISEGESYLLSGTFSDPGTNEAMVRIFWGDGQTEVVQVGPPASGTEWSFNAQHPYLDDEPTGTRRDTYQVQAEVVTDRVLAAATTVVIVSNQPPVIGALTVSSPLVSTGVVFQARAEFGDFGHDTHAAMWSWGDGMITPIPDATSPLITTHAYSSPGIYTITNAIADDDGGSAAATYSYVVAHNPGAFGGAGAGQIYARLCDTNQPPNCTTENARFGFVLDQVTGFFHARFTLPGLDVNAVNYQRSGTNASGQLEVEGPCAINGINNLLVVLTNTFENIVTTYVTNSTGIITNFVTNVITRVETNTATFTYRIRAAQSPTNTFQIRLSAHVGTNLVAQSLETDANQPVRSGAVIINPLRPAPSKASAQTLSPLRILKSPPPVKRPKAAPPQTKKRPLTNRR